MLEAIADRRNKEKGAVMGLGEHLEELRKRLVHALLGLVPIFVLAAVFSGKLIHIMLLPLLASLDAEGQATQLLSTGPLEAFASWFKVSLVTTAVVGGPWIVYNLWKFVAPGLYAHERRFAYVLSPLSIGLTIAGLLMMYYLMLPVGLKWLVGFGTGLAPESVAVAPLPPGVSLPAPMPVLNADPPDPQPGQMWVNNAIHAVRVCVLDSAGKPEVRGFYLSKATQIAQQYRIKEYVDLFFGLALAFAICFQLPVVVLLLGWVGIVNTKMLGKYRRHAVIACLILGAAISPTPDPVNLLWLQVPMYMLYELGIILLKLMPASRIIGKSGYAERERDEGGGP